MGWQSARKPSEGEGNSCSPNGQSLRPVLCCVVLCVFSKRAVLADARFEFLHEIVARVPDVAATSTAEPADKGKRDAAGARKGKRKPASEDDEEEEEEEEGEEAAGEEEEGESSSDEAAAAQAAKKRKVAPAPSPALASTPPSAATPAAAPTAEDELAGF